jgi:20S proteasome subunit beta 3
MSIMEYNGGAVVAMMGNGCVAIASDKRFGIQLQTVSMNFPKIYSVVDNICIGLCGLATDIQTFSSIVQLQCNMYELEENRKIQPRVLSRMVSRSLYEKRFSPYFCESIMAGIDTVTGEPFLCSMDILGCTSITDNFVVGGTCSSSLYGMCEALYRPGMEPEDLFETISNILCSSLNRDALSGWGAVVYVIMSNKLVMREILSRMD